MIQHILVTVALSATLYSTSLAQQRQLQVRPEPGGQLINDVDQSTVALHPSTPYIESSTMLLADIDLEKLDVRAIGKWLSDFFGGPKDDPATEMLRGIVDSMKDAGSKHLFVTAATRSMIDRGPIVIVPCENPTVVGGLLTVLVNNAGKNNVQKVHLGDRMVLAGSATAIDRVTANEGVERPDLILPLKREGLLDHTAVIVLPDEARRDLVALWPDRLPDESPIQFSPRAMAADISKIVVSLKMPPQPLMLAHVETTDALAADRVKEVLEEMLALGGDAASSVELSVDVATVKLTASPDSLVKVVMAVASPSRDRASQKMTQNNLRQIGLAVHNYHQQEKHLPPRCFTDDAGKPILSVRVALLPFIEQMALYESMKLDEPWDSDANEQFSGMFIPVYCDDPKQPAKTTIRFPVFPGSLWHGDGPPKVFRDVTDGTSYTIAAIDAPASAAIEWANPQPWVLSDDDPMSDVFGDRETATVLMLDGASLVLQKSQMTNEKLKAMLTIAGGEANE